MKTIIRYEAEDGAVFKTSEACLKHEQLLLSASQILSALPARPEDTEFTNGRGWIQHDPEVLLAVYTRYLRLILDTTGPFKWLTETMAKPKKIHPSWVARYIGECDSALYRGFHRFLCINFKKAREYGQPYYVDHVDEVKGGPL